MPLATCRAWRNAFCVGQLCVHSSAFVFLCKRRCERKLPCSAYSIIRRSESGCNKRDDKLGRMLSVERYFGEIDY